MMWKFWEREVYFSSKCLDYAKLMQSLQGLLGLLVSSRSRRGLVNPSYWGVLIPAATGNRIQCDSYLTAEISPEGLCGNALAITILSLYRYSQDFLQSINVCQGFLHEEK